MAPRFVLVCLVGSVFGIGGCGAGLGWGEDANEPLPARGGNGGECFGCEPPPAPPFDDGSTTGDPAISGGESSGGQGVEAGVLTAADWDDNLNFAHYLDYLADFAERVPEPPLPGIAVADRVVIRVVDDYGLGVRDALVRVEAGDTATELRTGSDGRTLYLPAHDGGAATYTVQATVGVDSASATFAAELDEWTLTLATARGPATRLDLAFVIDTTGSMADEISYLQAELDWVVASLAADHPGLELRLALVAYRDIGDEYVVRSRGFSSDVPAFLDSLGALSANGGGDYPEAVAEALVAAMALEWSSDDAVRLAFLVGDAPPQVNRQVSTVDAAGAARAAGVRIYPVASSGVADLAEWVFRQLAQVTGARYLFLTDDSGVGNEHAEPHIPCYLVQQLNLLLVRVIESELYGVRLYPPTDEVLRTAGDPLAGQCLVEEQVYYY